MRNVILLPVIAALMLLSLPAAAEEKPIYESLSDVTIGRVFFSAKQRSQLDALRGKTGVVSSSSAKPRATSRKATNPDAAGFIVRTSGKARVYRNGDFVEVAAEPDVKFPDDVTVKREPGAEEVSQDEKPD